MLTDVNYRMRVLRFEADGTEGETGASVGRDRSKTKAIHSN